MSEENGNNGNGRNGNSHESDLHRRCDVCKTAVVNGIKIPASLYDPEREFLIHKKENPLFTDSTLSYQCALESALKDAEINGDYSHVEIVIGMKDKFPYKSCNFLSD